MPTSEHKGGTRTLSLAMALAGLAAAGASGAAAQQALPDAAIMQYHSYARENPRISARIMAGPSLWRGDLAAAREAWKAGRYGEARKAFKRAWNSGSLVAAWYLGHIYRLGRGVKADPARAFYYYRQVALAYDADDINRKRLMMTVDALVRVADYYRTGIGKAKKRRDPRRAFRLYNIAAGHGHPDAFYGLALLALRGQGMKKHPRRAAGWLMKAALGGHARAARLLGSLAERGVKGAVRQDLAAAVSWYRIAAQRLPARDAASVLARAEKLEKRLSPQQYLRAGRMVQAFNKRQKSTPRALISAR